MFIILEEKWILGSFLASSPSVSLFWGSSLFLLFHLSPKFSSLHPTERTAVQVANDSLCSFQLEYCVVLFSWSIVLFYFAAPGGMLVTEDNGEPASAIVPCRAHSLVQEEGTNR